MPARVCRRILSREVRVLIVAVKRAQQGLGWVLQVPFVRREGSRGTGVCVLF